MSNDFDGKVLNPSGVEIDLPFWVFKRLKKLHLLERDLETGKRRIQARIFGLMEIWDGPDFRPDRKFRAFDPAFQRVCSSDSGYNYDWRITSRAYLARNPLCVECMKQRRVVAATVTDHIIPHKGDPALFWDPNNWQALCKPCHDRKTALQDGRWG